MPNDDARQLLDAAQRSGLLSAAEVEAVTGEFQAAEDLTQTDLAQRLVEKQLLTPFQAEQLLAGKAEDCVLAGRYRILDCLGAGGMGAVYRAQDTELDRTVAIKVIAPQHLDNPDAVARFRREAKALAKVSHPAIVQAHDVGEDQGRHFLVMEYVEGQSLAQLLKEKGRVSPALAADYVYQAAIGLHHAHQKGLVHRDVKPGNLLLTPDRQIKILDLGLARFVQDQIGDGTLTREGLAVGTPDYMAPEQFGDARHADHRADIYSLGCTLYQLLTGRVPFPGSSLSEKARAHCEQEPTPLEELCPDAPAGLVLVVRRMMAKRLEDRHQSAAEVAEALVPFVSSSSAGLRAMESTAAWQGSRPGTAVPKRRKWPIAVTVSSGAALAVLVLVAVAVYLRGPSTRDLPDIPASPPVTEGQPVSPPAPSVDPNVLTVAQDGSGMFRTIGEALEKVKPGMTVRILDDAVYREAILIGTPAVHAGVTLEAADRATVTPPAGATGITVLHVPRVTVRRLRIQSGAGVPCLAMVAGRSPGVTLDQLELEGASSAAGIGINLEGIAAALDDAPVVVRNCRVQNVSLGIRVCGVIYDNRGGYQGPVPCGHVIVCDNRIAGSRQGILLVGAVRRALVVGNLVCQTMQVGIQLEQLLPGTEGLLVANNTIFDAGSAFRLWDSKVTGSGIELRNNLLLGSREADMVFADSGGQQQTMRGPGDGKAVTKAWQFSHNVREGRPPQGDKDDEKAWIPPGPADTLKDKIEVLSRDAARPDFLQPATGSPLATGGAGGDLPSYVGAVAPEGGQPWDWQKTWQSRHPKTLLTVSQDPKDGGEFRTIGAALEKVKPGMTVRILDSATYKEALLIDRARAQNGITLEAVAAATIAPPAGSNGVVILNVPSVTLRGLRFRADAGLSFVVAASGHTPGLLLDRLEIETVKGHNCLPVTLEAVKIAAEEPPAVVQHCRIQGGSSGIRVCGIVFEGAHGYGGPLPCARVVLRDNEIVGAGSGITLVGSVQEVLVVGNRICDASTCGIQVENLLEGARRIVIANNSMLETTSALRVWDSAVKGADIEVRNNLALGPRTPDMEFVDSGGTRQHVRGPGDGRAIARAWQFSHNWRETKAPQGDKDAEKSWIPPSSADVVKDKIDILSRDPARPDFLRPAKDSPLAAGGTGGDLPKYVGAVPPEGTEPWDWDRTWKATMSAKPGEAGKAAPAEKSSKQK